MSGSPAISAADDSTLPLDILDVDSDSDVTEVLPLDYNGDTRTHGCLLDIGAIEYQGNDMAIVVTNTNDSGPGSFKAALACAPDGSTITFDPALDGNPIILTSSSIGPANNNITIQGNGQANTIVDASGGSGRIFFLSGRTLTVKDMTFHKTGGAIITDLGAAFFLDNSTDLTLDNVQILDISTGSFKNLFQIQILSKLSMSNCFVKGNDTYILVYDAGNGTQPSIFNQCLWIENTVSNDLLFLEAATTLTQNTFANNTVSADLIDANSSTNTISNNVFYSNTVGVGDKHVEVSTSGLTASSNICETPTDLPTSSYIDEDPLFVNPSSDNYKLQACSPAIGRADASAAPAADTEGHLRPTGFGVDIGWDEYTGATCPEGQCSQPVDIACGSNYTDDNFDGANNISTINVPGGGVQSVPGPEKIFKITTSSIGNIDVVLTSAPSSIYTFITSDCTDGTTALAFGNGGTITYPNASAGDYYIIFDAFSAYTDDFGFTVNADYVAGPCTENTVTLDTPEDPMGLYHAIIDIQSNTTINNDATYKAGSFIELNEGFEVTAGQVFEAIIEPCPN